MAKTIPCTALVEFTVFVEGHGQVVGAPESSLDEARKPAIPEHALDRFVEGGLVKAPKGWAKAKEDEAAEIAAAETAADTEAAAAAAQSGGSGDDDQAPA